MSTTGPAPSWLPGRLLEGLSIKGRVLLLSAMLLAGLIWSTLYLTSVLGTNVAQIKRDAEMARRLDLVVDIRSSFGDYRYWLTDLAVSLLQQSELKAKEARAQLDRELVELAKGSPELAAGLRADVDRFAISAIQAVDAYTDDKRVIRNALFAEARTHGSAVDARLTALADQIGVEAAESRQTMVISTEASTRKALITVALASLLGIIATWVVLRSILRPLDQVVTAINGITAGQLDTPIPPAGRDEIGAMAGTLQLFRASIVDRERIARISQAQQRMMTTAIETTSDGFAVFDRKGRIIVCNTKFKELYPGIADLAEPGIPLASIVAALVERDLVDTGDLSGQAWVEKQLSLPGSQAAFSGYRHPATFIRISERATPDGGMVSVYTDVTELKQRQQELEAAMVEAEAANVAKSSFLANMSHELRTPLNAIIGYSEILQEMAQDDGLDEYTRDLSKIQSAGRHLLNLISDILDLSKIEAGKMDLYLEDVSIPCLLDEISAIVKPLVEKNRNVLQIHCPPEIGALHTDRTKLKQNLLNLLSNATKFTSSGTVTLTIKRDTEIAHSPVTFTVQDTGIGMTPEQVAKLFSPFAQADASTTKRYGGTGLGLAITRHFCEILGGSIRVDSTAGVGSTFTMVLPSRLPPPAAPSADQSMRLADAERDVSAPLVMVVDDDAASRELMAIVLRKEGWRVVEAGSGEVALEMARKLKPSAITLDIMMPHMDGWSVLTALKADPELAGIPVVVVTIAADRGFAFSLGANDFMTKPIDRLQLGSLMHHLLDDAATILMVDDDPQSRELIQHQLKLANIAFLEAGSGKQAIEWLSANAPPSLILLDLMMPEMDGFMFLQEISRHAEWASIPVVVVTAKELTAQERDWLGEHARAVIAKSAGSSRDLSTEVRLALRAPGRSERSS
jgi:signal transduction histidine kinase/CheY-like chemotaxis protein/HAMP domain-containing protein